MSYYEKHKVVYKVNEMGEKEPIMYYSDILLREKEGHKEYEDLDSIKVELEARLQKLLGTDQITVELDRIYATAPASTRNNYAYVPFHLFYKGILLAINCYNFISLEEIKKSISLIEKFAVTKVSIIEEVMYIETTSDVFKIDTEYRAGFASSERNYLTLTNENVYKMSMQVAEKFRKEGAYVVAR